MAAAGVGGVFFFNIRGNHLTMKKGIYEKNKEEKSAITSIGLLDDTIITGNFKGDLCQWEGIRVIKKIEAEKAHTGPVNSIC